MKKLPNGISNYEKLVEEGYYYVDKTLYIEKLEQLTNPTIMFLRPRKFGKTLFTSVLENYYDIMKKDKFEELFKETYIGKNPTDLKNSYHILRFNFSEIDTSSVESTINGFRREVTSSIRLFTQYYNMDFYINENDEAEDVLDNLFKAFLIQRNNEKIYVLIDEYDHFANELLGFYPEQFRDLVSKNGKVRKWYEILKKGTESIVDRIFITGVAPITLDSLTSGFNISKDITQDEEFNEMMGFTENELKELFESQEISIENQSEILPIMKDYYDGYRFSINSTIQMYNSNMCLYFLSDYVRLGKIPNKLIDVNIASDYNKIGKMLDLCKGEKREKVIEDTVSGEGIVSDIVEKFNPAIEFGDKELVSMLYYLGYLTITGESLGMPKLQIPNKVMKKIYSSFFMELLKEKTDIQIEDSEYNKMLEEIALHGKIDTLVRVSGEYLNNLSNRDFQRFDEKYVKLIFYCISMNFGIYRVKSEMEVHRKYPDLLLIPKDRSKGYKSVMIEFKYLKKDEENKLEEKQKEAKEQINEYSEMDEIKEIQDLSKFTIVAVNDKLFIEKI